MLYVRGQGSLERQALAGRGMHEGQAGRMEGGPGESAQGVAGGRPTRGGRAGTPVSRVPCHGMADRCQVHADLVGTSGVDADAQEAGPLEGLEEAPINLCVTCDRTRSGPHVLGRNTVVDTDLYSTCCAVQNLWLAARVEGVGVGWVSIVDYEDLRPILGIPATVVPVAYLCIGYPREFFEEPELQRRGWATRLKLEQIVYQERWGVPADENR